VRVEERQVDGLELDQLEQQQQTKLAEKDEELPELAGEEVVDVEGAGHDVLLGLMHRIFEGKHVNLAALSLPQREERALQALQSAVSGRRTNLDTFLYAVDRRSLLEQALAVLQPNLVHGVDPQLAAMNAELQHLAKNVTELRENLVDLEDGQDEAMAVRPKHLAGQAVGETADKPSDGVNAAPDAEATGTPDGAKADKAKADARAKRSKRSDGPAPATPPEAEIETAPKRSTLSEGPDVVREERPTTLGDPADIAAAHAALPWWRRPSR